MSAARGARRAALFLALLAAPFGARAGAQEYFGQNQVQYHKFAWRVLETEHFLIYYYPEERRATMDAARMAERSYARLSRLLDHQFREKKPLILFSSRTDFGQNNVTGDLGEATGGVTEALRHRMLLNFTGDYRSFEHVLTHEMTHAFQYDIFARGKAGAGLQTLAQVNPPLWFAEGMAEYLSLGPQTALTDMWMRDAALNGKLPTIEQMTDEPEQYFPYRFGHAFWAYIGKRWGDEAIGQIMNAAPSVGIERAFNRELGESLDDIGDEWKDEMQTHYLPGVASLERPRKFAQPLLTKRKSGGEIFLAPALSNDGKRIAFLSNGSWLRGQVFIDLWLGDAESGKRIKRLVKSTTDPNFEELRLLYSQSAFSPDGKQLAFTAQREGRDVLYIADVHSTRIDRRIDLPIEGVTSPSWSPDGKRLVVSGNDGGITDLFVVDADGSHAERLTNDRFGDLQPQWSPDGKSIAFACDRGDDASFALLRFPHWRICLMDLATQAISVLPGQDGHNLNPQWAPDGRSIAYISDRTGIPNVFLFDFATNEHYQLTNVVGGISAITEYSPAISWARKADRMAFTYYEDGGYTIWMVDNPRGLKKGPFRVPAAPTVVAQNPAAPQPGAPAPDTTPAPAVVRAPAAHADSTPQRTSYYRTPSGELRRSSALPSAEAAPLREETVSVTALLDSAALALPDTTKFRDEPYHVRYQPDYVARPSIGYAPDNFGRNVFGGTTVIMSDMLGGNRLAFSGEINGRINEANLFLGYTSLGNRWQYSTGLSQSPYYFLSRDTLSPPTGSTLGTESQEITTYVIRQAFAVSSYPFNRFSRIEVGGGFNNIDRERWYISRDILTSTTASTFKFDSTRRDPSINYFDAQFAYVSDNVLFGYTGPLLGRRYRLQVSPVVGAYNWVEYLADYRRYDPIIFNYLTVATRFYTNVAIGANETAFPKYIARPDFVRGYDRNAFFTTCPIFDANTTNCSAVQLLGSRVAVANAELRFPIVRQIELGVLPMTLPPVEGLFFYDAGVAWSRGQKLLWSRPQDYDLTRERYPLRSYGFGLRLNLFNYAMLRWDYAVPLDSKERKGFWTWSLWPSF